MPLPELADDEVTSSAVAVEGLVHGRKPRKRRSKAGLKDSAAQAVPAGLGHGVMHVCDFTACRLPAEDWYLAAKNSRT